MNIPFKPRRIRVLPEPQHTTLPGAAPDLAPQPVPAIDPDEPGTEARLAAAALPLAPGTLDGPLLAPLRFSTPGEDLVGEAEFRELLLGLAARVRAAGDIPRAVATVRYDACALLEDPDPADLERAAAESFQEQVAEWALQSDPSPLRRPLGPAGEPPIPPLGEQRRLAVRLAVQEAALAVLGLDPGAPVAHQICGERLLATRGRVGALALRIELDVLVGDPPPPGCSDLVDPDGFQAMLLVAIDFRCLPGFSGLLRESL